jgi:hypothetical protein
MPRPNTKRPDCVIDGSQDPTVMRCKHCGGTEPLALPMDLNEVVKLTKVFEQKHAFCHLSLLALRSKERLLRDTLKSMPPNDRAYDATRGKLYDVEAAIRRQEPDPNKWP